MADYELRRAILTAFYEYKNPQELRVLLFNENILRALGKLVLTGDDTLPVRAEIDRLVSTGHLEPITGFQEWYKLPADLRLKLDEAEGKIERSVLKTDPVLFGPSALR